MSLDLLFHAIRGDATESAALLAAGADPNITLKCFWSTVIEITAGSETLSPSELPIWRLLMEREKQFPVTELDRTWTPLLLAAWQSHYDVVLTLLDHGADPNHADEDGFTALLAAVQQADRRSALALLNTGTNPNARDHEGETPLLFAAEKGHLPLVTALLAAGADPNTATQWGATPLMRAAQQGKPELREGFSRFQRASRDERRAADAPSFEPRYVDVLRILLEHGAQVNAATHDPDHLHEGAMRALHFAALRGCWESSVLLLDAGANPNAVSEHYGTPLQCAVAGGNREIVLLLRERGADVSLASSSSTTPLMTAASKGDVAGLDLLFGWGADIHAQRESEGDDALFLAVQNGHPEAVEWLLNHGARVDTRTSKGVTALMAAAHYGHPDVVRLLLDAGADPHTRDEKDRSVFEHAQSPTFAQRFANLKGDLQADLDRELETGPAALAPLPPDIQATTATTIRNNALEMLKPIQEMHDTMERRAQDEQQRKAAVLSLLQERGIRK